MKTPRLDTAVTALLLVLVGHPVGCGGTADDASPRPPRASPQSAPALVPAGMPSIEPADVDELQGSVREVLDAGHYTYVRLGLGSDDRWVVVLGTPDIDPGDAIDVAVYGHRHDFPSRRLDRSFDELFFGRIRSST